MNFGLGFQRLLDAQQKYVRNSLPVYLRLRDFEPVNTTLWGQLGFSISPSGTASVGTTDIEIVPPPAVRMVSMHNIGMSGGQLFLGARTFTVSGTFVRKMAALLGVAERQVWEGKRSVGLVTDGLLFSTQQIEHNEVAGLTVGWLITCNANELK